jgi:hypothetical protein
MSIAVRWQPALSGGISGGILRGRCDGAPKAFVSRKERSIAGVVTIFRAATEFLRDRPQAEFRERRVSGAMLAS